MRMIRKACTLLEVYWDSRGASQHGLGFRAHGSIADGYLEGYLEGKLCVTCMEIPYIVGIIGGFHASWFKALAS